MRPRSIVNVGLVLLTVAACLGLSLGVRISAIQPKSTTSRSSVSSSSESDVSPTPREFSSAELANHSISDPPSLYLNPQSVPIEFAIDLSLQGKPLVAPYYTPVNLDSLVVALLELLPSSRKEGFAFLLSSETALGAVTRLPFDWSTKVPESAVALVVALKTWVAGTDKKIVKFANANRDLQIGVAFPEVTPAPILFGLKHSNAFLFSHTNADKDVALVRCFPVDYALFSASSSSSSSEASSSNSTSSSSSSSTGSSRRASSHTRSKLSASFLKKVDSLSN